MRWIVSKLFDPSITLLILSFLLAPLPAFAEVSEGGDERPPSQYVLDSSLYPLRLHWVEDLPRARVARILGLFEKSWRIQVAEWGWLAPVPDGSKGGDDKLDVYLLPLDEGQADTILDKIQGDPFATASCFIQMDQNLADDGTLESYVHHEFNHALQFAMDPYETDSFYEQTASLVERLLLPDSPEATSGNADFQQAPYRALDSKSNSRGDRYEYGSTLFLQYLTSQYGGNTIDLTHQLWQLSRQPVRAKSADPNEPDWVDALSPVLQRYHAPGLEDVLMDFEVWRLKQGLAEKIPAPALAALGGHPLEFAVNPKQAPAPWGVTYLRLDAQGACALTIQLKDGGKSKWRLWASGMATNGLWLQSGKTEVGQGETSLMLPTTGARWVYVTVLNYGSEPKDPDLQQWLGDTYRLTFSWK